MLKVNASHGHCILPPGTKLRWNLEMFLLLKGSITVQQLTTPGPETGSPHPGLCFLRASLLGYEGPALNPGSPHLAVRDSSG